MPVPLLSYYAELVAFLELTPWSGEPYHPRNPEGGLRKMIFGPNSEALATYVILEQQRRVVVVSLVRLD